MSRMPSSPDFDHRIADWLEEDPDRAPGPVLGTVLAAFPSIPQRRASRVPWRFQPMNRFALFGAAVATIAVVGLGGMLLTSRPDGPAVGGTPTTTPAPSPSPSPSASLPPPLTETFTSSMHGISIAYPAGWQARPATEPWTNGWGFDDPAGDILFDPSVDGGQLFISIASRPLAGTAGDRWTADVLALPEPRGYECGFSTAPVTIDGAPGRTGCSAATVAVGGRGYFILLYTGDDVPWAKDVYDQAWFEELLASVDLRPEDAVPPPLTEPFTSSMHGISIAYPAGWQAAAATEPWTMPGWAGFGDPAGDILSDPAVDDGHLFISIASRPLAGTSADQWTADTLAQPEPQGYGCESSAPVTIDGAPGRTGCNAATAAIGGRGYLILLYTSDDEPRIGELYDQAWFETILATVDLRPEDAVDAVPSPSG